MSPIRWRIALAAALTMTLSACATVQTRDRVDDLELRVAALEEETATATTVTTTAPSTTTTGPTIVVEPVVAIAELVGPAVVQIETNVALGSGVIYTADGLVLTVAHVVEGEAEVIVRLFDGRAFRGTVLGAHDATDVAVVRIDDPPDDLAVAELAIGADLRVGQTAIVLGSPFGFDQTVTSGIISSVDRVIDSVVMIQTDAAINHGNSGGPVVDGAGRVIGLSDVIFSDTGESAGVGFAIRIDLAIIVAEQLVAGDVVRLAFLGVTTSADPDQPGARVDSVANSSPASEAGFLEGDVIISVDGVVVTDPDDLRARVLTKREGDEITVTILRDGILQDVKVTLGSTTR